MACSAPTSHAGDGNLHPLIMFDGNDPVQAEKAQQYGSEILTTCVEHGGTITGEHGVASRRSMKCVCSSQARIDAVPRVKAGL